MSTQLSRILFSAVVALASCIVISAQSSASGTAKSTSAQQTRGAIATLYGLDPLARAICFRDGGEGLVFQNKRLRNRCSDLSYTFAGDGSFVAGIEGGRVAAIVDLGTPDDLRGRYGYDDADGGGDGFASLRLAGKEILILKEDQPREVLQPLKETGTLFTGLGPSANAPIKLGHIYLLRIADTKDSTYQQIVKLMVIAYRLNESVTIRWEPL